MKREPYPKRKTMSALSVPFKKQISIDACSVAAFEMVYRYFHPSALSKFSQQKTFRMLTEKEPHGSGNLRVSSDKLTTYARQRNFKSGWGRVSRDQAEAITQLNYFLETSKIPVIACQRYTDEWPLIGHFRVIFGIEGSDVLLHDPAFGPDQRWPIEKMLDYWRPTGENVTGGVVIWIARQELEHIPVRIEPNPWLSDRWQPKPV